VGKKADLVLIKNDSSPVSFPILHPYGHVVFQAGRGDVHTVLVNGNPDHETLSNPYTYRDDASTWAES
jgi:cytosine/adenosine deaminase-related metal-dependent hydrolase